ncbi:MAG: GxxExxY protein [Oceanococcaceae bacterium]
MGGRDPQTYAVIGAAMAVHGELGPGFLESIYGDALEIELRARAIPYEREASVRVRYRDHLLPSVFRADYLCAERLLLELKATPALGPAADAQLLHYLKATRIHKGLLLNFGSPRLQYKRLVL